MKNTKLRIVWIIPNVFCYLMVVVFSIFVALNAKGLQEIRRLGIWVFAMIIAEAQKRKIYHLFLISSEMGKPLYKKMGFKENDIYMEYFPLT